MLYRVSGKRVNTLVGLQDNRSCRNGTAQHPDCLTDDTSVGGCLGMVV